jgi:hypothetical protein
MGERIQIPDIPEEARTPLVKGLVDVMEQLVQKVRQQEEKIAQLEDEIAVLKGEKKRPRFKPSQLDKRGGRADGIWGEGTRPGSEKRSKTALLVIHEEEIIAPAEAVPEGSRFKGYREVVVQDLVIRAHNTRYRLERWETPEGRTLMGELPVSVRGGHFGVTLVSYIVYQHHHCQVTQPLLLEQLREWGIDISAGQIEALLTGKHEPFHEEKDALLPAAYVSASYLTVDETGARHRGQNGYTTHTGLGARSRRAVSTFCNSCEQAMRTTGSMQRPWLICRRRSCPTGPWKDCRLIRTGSLPMRRTGSPSDSVRDHPGAASSHCHRGRPVGQCVAPWLPEGVTHS